MSKDKLTEQQSKYITDHYSEVDNFLKRFHPRYDDVDELRGALHQALVESVQNCNCLELGFEGNNSYFNKAFRTAVNNYFQEKKESAATVIDIKKPVKRSNKKDVRIMKFREKYNPKFNNMNKIQDNGDITYIPDKSIEVIDAEILQLFIRRLIKSSNLSNREDEVLRLKFMNDLTYSDISHQLQITVSSIQKYKDRAIQKLTNSFHRVYGAVKLQIEYIEGNLEEALSIYFK